MTFLGKLLVFFNVFIAFAMLAFAISLYTNRIEWTEARDGDAKVTDRIPELQKKIVASQAKYTTARAPIVTAERDYNLYLNALAVKLNDANTGNFLNLIPDGRTLDLRSNLAIPAITKGPNGQPRNLPGVAVLQAELVEAVKKSNELDQAINLARSQQSMFGAETLVFNAKTNRLRIILDETASQKIYLSENQVNWDEQLATLKKRNDQLAKRLDELKKDPKTLAPAFPAFPTTTPTIVAFPKQ